jgi:hypothetical protein
MKKGVLSIEEVRIWPPDFGEKLPVHGQLFQAGSIESQPEIIF